MLQGKLEQLASLLVRPKRRTYDIEKLGPKFFKTQYCNCQRHDFDVQFTYGQTYGYKLFNNQPNYLKKLKPIKLKCSIFIPLSKNKNCALSNACESNICVLAMHGNTGSRISTITALQPVVKYGLSFAIFDFGGCGNSDGEYVTLGYYQKYQISAVLEEIYNQYGYHKFILYGRSMGAASALFYSSIIYPEYINHKQRRIIDYFNKILRQNQAKQFTQKQTIDVINKLNQGYFGYEVIGLVTDSPYYSTQGAINDLVNQRIWFAPSFLVNWILGIVEKRASQILKRAGLGKMPQHNPMKQKQIKHKSQIDTISNQSNLNLNNTKQKQQNNQIPILSILNDVKIPTETQIPFPVYLIYGLNDDVISKKHTFQLFSKLQCDNKKLHILVDQGHGNHRDDQIKIAAFEWILQWEVKRMENRIIRDSKIVGLKLEQFLKLSNNTNLKQNCKVQNKQKELSTQIISQKTGSFGSITSAQVEIYYGSSTSLQNNQPKSYQRLKKLIINQTQKVSSVIFGQKQNQNQNKISNLQQQDQRNINMQQIMKMSRIFPYRNMKLNINTNANTQQKQVQYTEQRMCNKMNLHN